ncbi:MAG: hypothetical protein WCJ58_04035 [bacterium]
MASVLEISLSVHKEAETILKKTDVINYLKPFGNIRIAGSYYTELMYNPDIDLAVVSANPRQSALEFLQLMIGKKLFQKCEYGDFELFPIANRPKSQIVVLVLPYKGKRWEIEIWFVKEFDKKQLIFEEQLKRLPQNIKAEIIQRKIDRERSGLDKKALSSYQIYQNYVAI